MAKAAIVTIGPGEQARALPFPPTAGTIFPVDERQRGKALMALNRKTLDVLEKFRDELKRTKRWSALHQAAFVAWKRHLADAEDRVRNAAGRKWPRSAWDLAAAELQRERAYWTKALESARRNPGRKIGTEIFEDAGAG